MRKKKANLVSSNPKSSVTADIKSKTKGRKTRDKLTRVGIVSSPIQGKITQAKQWNRWTP